ncbi:LPXTG cell wall anchor domain-containing protein [Methanobacterium sp. ACI-7]
MIWKITSIATTTTDVMSTESLVQFVGLIILLLIIIGIILISKKRKSRM